MASLAEEHFVGKVALKALIVRKNGSMLVNSDATHSSWWDFPGGRMNVGETPEEGLMREVKEELGIDIVVGSPIYTDTFVRKSSGDPHFLVMYACTMKDESQPIAVDPKEIGEVRWITKDNMGDVVFVDAYARAWKALFD